MARQTQTQKALLVRDGDIIDQLAMLGITGRLLPPRQKTSSDTTCISCLTRILMAYCKTLTVAASHQFTVDVCRHCGSQRATRLAARRVEDGRRTDQNFLSKNFLSKNFLSPKTFYPKTFYPQKLSIQNLSIRRKLSIQARAALMPAAPNEQRTGRCRAKQGNPAMLPYSSSAKPKNAQSKRREPLCQSLG